MCKNGNNEELRYSIRSTVENLPPGNIWVVGGKPSWYTGDYMPVRPIGGAYENVQNQLKIVCQSNNISDDFVLMNDDFFTLSKSNVPNWNGGLLENKIANFNRYAPENLYVKKLLRLQRYLAKDKNAKPIDYELHVPMVMNKEKLKSIIDLPYLPRSLYGNKFNVGGDEYKDVKIYNNCLLLDKTKVDIDEMQFISTTDQSFKYISKWMEKRFPDASPYELP